MRGAQAYKRGMTAAATPRFELVSFALCPYVQRSVITLKHKRIDFKITYIDLASPPEWFEKESPLGKVPLLFVREPGAEPVTLFESAVINEYLDEVTPPAITQKDPLKKAFERAWIEVGAELLGLLYPIMASSDLGEIEESRDGIFEILAQVERALPGGATFRGGEFSLVDAAFAPFFMRLSLYKPLAADARWEALPKTRRWAEALLALPEVRDSVLADFKTRFAEFARRHKSPWAGELAL